ncbi:hypothetical protein [Paraburkholderia youngii]|uniref:hypothetical protein n=1 Tax=Paraburkholderia youngii TaxID=2782701 RepID=UPI0015910F33|nr:hypothetical protein [Paraburkholderia youngii]NUX58715.1 hypothetical protein [Paraburkholderia youngii]
MTDEKSKYDGAASVARNMTEGAMVALLVFNGNRGTGFAVHALHPELMKLLPDMLEFMARHIREEQAKETK